MTDKTEDIRYMKMALDEAARAFDEDEVPVGAVVVCKGRVIARAHNLTETLTDVTAHAEMQAVTAAANFPKSSSSSFKKSKSSSPISFNSHSPLLSSPINIS